MSPKQGLGGGALALALASFALPSCSGPVEASSTCADFETTSSAIHNGSRSQKFLELDQSELDAVVFVQAQLKQNQVSCSGVLVDPLWVMTAKHCLLDGARMWVRNARGWPSEVAYTVAHPSADVALLSLTRAIEGARPFRFGTENVAEYLHSKAEVAGFGFDTRGEMGKLAFQVVTLIETTSGIATVTGDRSGACFGDSGAPLISRAPDGQAVVLGTLSGGAPSCTGIDQYVRADSVAAWMQTYFVPTLSGQAAGCGELRDTSRCYGSVAAYCDQGVLAAERCEGSETCGYDAELGRFGCTSDDPCRGVDALGVCQDGQVTRCEAGTLVRTECGCDEACAVSGATGLAQCVNVND
jgi:hypothetical protein